MSASTAEVAPLYRLSSAAIAAAILCAGLTLVAFHEGVTRMVQTWLTSDEYSHGLLIPFIAAFLVWQRKHEWQQVPFAGQWSGVAVVVFGALLNFVGKLAGVFTLQQYALIVVVAGLVVALGGVCLLRKLTVPVVMLLFMVPIPNFFMNELSAQLQLLSSQLGVALLRLTGTSVLLTGNVIDLGAYKLQVADACSGLRYLFPLMTLGFIMAYFFRAPWWKRAVVFLSSIPITVGMNSARIAVIGITVERWGTQMAEGVLHDFEGWVVFMLCTLTLAAEVMLFARLGGDRRPWSEIFGIELPARTTNTRPGTRSALPVSFVTATGILACVAVAIWMVATPAESIPQRESFETFPQQLDGWRAHRTTLEPVYLDTLKLDDYVMSDYRRADSSPINFYVAWYNSQRAGQSAHSPRSCLPGGGWRIMDLRQASVPQVQMGAQPLVVNRALVQQGENRQLVYYWFQQRGRVVTNEYLVKWYLFWDSLTRHRTDGALVRLVTPLKSGANAEEGDRVLAGLLREVAPVMSRYVPD